MLFYLIFKNGETKIQVKIQPASETDLNVSKDDSLLMQSKTPMNEIDGFINGDLCLYGVSLKYKENLLLKMSMVS